MYGLRLLMMDGETVRNMKLLFQNEINLRYCASGWFDFRNTLRCAVLQKSKETNMSTKIGFDAQLYSCVHLLLPLLHSPTYSIDKRIIDQLKFLQMLLHVMFLANAHVYIVINSVKYVTF